MRTYPRSAGTLVLFFTLLFTFLLSTLTHHLLHFLFLHHVFFHFFLPPFFFGNLLGTPYFFAQRFAIFGCLAYMNFCCALLLKGIQKSRALKTIACFQCSASDIGFRTRLIGESGYQLLITLYSTRRITVKCG